MRPRVRAVGTRPARASCRPDALAPTATSRRLFHAHHFLPRIPPTTIFHTPTAHNGKRQARDTNHPRARSSNPIRRLARTHASDETIAKPISTMLKDQAKQSVSAACCSFDRVLTRRIGMRSSVACVCALRRRCTAAR
jgi:hypothetical protein